jgi:hypothetical protein
MFGSHFTCKCTRDYRCGLLIVIVGELDILPSLPS